MTKFGNFDFSILHTYPWYLQKGALKRRVFAAITEGKLKLGLGLGLS